MFDAKNLNEIHGKHITVYKIDKSANWIKQVVKGIIRTQIINDGNNAIDMHSFHTLYAYNH